MKRVPKSAAKVVVLDNSEPISAEIEAVQSLIRRRAFELSQQGLDHSREFYDWIAAESEIISVPPAEVIEKDGMIQAKFVVAGVNPEDVNVMAASDQILLRSDNSHRHESNDGTVHFCDFKSATVFRSVTLPKRIDVKSIKVSVEDGMLSVTAAEEDPPPAVAAAPRRAASRKPAAKKTKKLLRDH
jgi:HSP20 family molecular chaperone IbpA